MVQVIIAAICFAVAIFCFVTEVVGLYRFNYIMNRMHVTSIGDTFGIAFILIGVMVLRGFSLTLVKILLVGAFMMLTGPALSHLIGEMEVMHNEVEHDTRKYKKEDRL